MLLSLVAVLAVATMPHGARLDGRWSLGHGYAARVYEQHRFAGSTDAHRTFELSRGNRGLRRWRVFNEAMPVIARDITGDGIRDVLVVDYIGGSAACESYRLYGGPTLRELWSKRNLCEDWARVRLRAEGVDLWLAIGSSKTKSSDGSIHCCWRRWRHREWRWEHSRLRLVRRPVTTHPPQWVDPGMRR